VLQQLGADESAVRYPPLPRWFFALQAAAVAGVFLAQLLAPSDALNATLATALASTVLGVRYWLNRDGISWVTVKLADMVPFLTALLTLGLLCVAVSATTGAQWIWVVGAFAASAVVLRTGRRYQREFGDDV